MLQNKLGDALRNARMSKGLTLRDASAKSKSKISNAYISLLETGKILIPDPRFLKILAELYDVNYLTLLIMAGYLTMADLKKYKGKI